MIGDVPAVAFRDVFGISDVANLAVLEPHDAIAQPRDLLQIVTDEENGRARPGKGRTSLRQRS